MSVYVVIGFNKCVFCDEEMVKYFLFYEICSNLLINIIEGLS